MTATTDRVVIFDTTLRDGEQCPGATMTYEEKLEVADCLDALGVDAERPAGFEDIESLPQKFIVMPADVARMKAYIAANTGL